ncbi:Major facilitator superfamily domain containing protein [Rhypophila sp. PSN 637]
MVTMDPAPAGLDRPSIRIVIDPAGPIHQSMRNQLADPLRTLEPPMHQRNGSSSRNRHTIARKPLPDGHAARMTAFHTPGSSGFSSVSTLAPVEKKTGIQINIELNDLKAGLGKSTTVIPPAMPLRPVTVINPLHGLGITFADDLGQPSISQPYMNRFRLLAVSLLNFANGLGDSAAGALLPSIQKQYDLTYATVSLIFVGQALGYILAAPVIDAVRERFGRSKTLAATQLLLAVGVLPLIATAPYPLVVLSFFVFGICESFNLAIGNVFCGSLTNGTTALGIMHGAYGLGGIVGPLIATTLVTRTVAVWGFYYFIVVGFALINCCFSAWCFWSYETETKRATGTPGLAEAGLAGMFDEEPIIMGGQQAISRDSGAVASLYGLLSAAATKVVLLGASFLFCYQGAEVSVSGWVLTFLLDHRNGDQKTVGYVTSGFWGGITLGRFLLSTPAQWIGEKRFVYGLAVLAGVFQLIVWLVPNIVADFVAVAILGFLLGPIYPCAAAVFMRAMTRDEQVRGMVIMSAFGSSGGAAAPFTTGLLAHAVGTFVLHPVAISLYGVMLVCWYFLPGKRMNRN